MSVNPKYIYKQGDIVVCDFEPGVGSETRKTRPALIVQGRHLNAISSLISVAPFTKNTKKDFPGDVFVTADEMNQLAQDSSIKTSEIHTFDRSRFLSVIGRLSPKMMNVVKAQLKRNYDL